MVLTDVFGLILRLVLALVLIMVPTSAAVSLPTVISFETVKS